MSAVVDCHKATGLYDQPLTDEPLCAVAQLLQFSIERLKVLLADEYSPFDLVPIKLASATSAAPMPRWAIRRAPWTVRIKMSSRPPTSPSPCAMAATPTTVTTERILSCKCQLSSLHLHTKRPFG